MADLPLTFRASPLPANFRGTPQQFLDALVARLSIETQVALALFVVGPIPPTSDQGPWLKNGTTWYVWDTATGTYIPAIFDPQSLRYIAQVTAPDPLLYTFWIVLDGAGKAQGIKYYSGGAWKDIYEDVVFTQAQTDAHIATGLNSVLADLEPYPAAAFTGGTQLVTMDGSINKVAYDTKAFDPLLAYNTALARYTAPASGYYAVTAQVQIDKVTADATKMEVSFYLTKNGAAQTTCGGGTSVDTPPGLRWYPSFAGMIQLVAGDYIEVVITGTATGTVNLSNGDWSIQRVRKIP